MALPLRLVRPATGDVEWWVADGIDINLFQRVLDAAARDIGAGPDKTVIPLIDNAGWHVGRRLNIPDGIRFCFSPPYTLEPQPAERLWPLANMPFETLDRRAEKLDRRCAALTDQPDLIKATTHFKLWPAE